MTPKHRLSASVDAELIEAAERAVERGEVPNVSAWVNEALRLKREHDRRLEALWQFVSAYEAEHGEIGADEIRDAGRRARARARSARTLEDRKPRRDRNRSKKRR